MSKPKISVIPGKRRRDQRTIIGGDTSPHILDEVNGGIREISRRKSLFNKMSTQLGIMFQAKQEMADAQDAMGSDSLNPELLQEIRENKK